MKFLKRAGIINVYIKNIKKSIHDISRIDLFIILALLIFASIPVFNYFYRSGAEENKINLYVSARGEELFFNEKAEALLLDFMERNPGLTVNLIKVSELSPELKPATEGDIFIFEDYEYNALVSDGLLADLNQFNNFSLTDSINAGKHQYSIPLVYFMDVLFYNIEILTSVGLDRPPKTREEFLSCARDISNIINANPASPAIASRAYVGLDLSLDAKDKQALSRDVFSWIWAAGGNFWSEENKPTLNATDTAGVLSFLKNLYQENTLNHHIFDSTKTRRVEEFANGKIAMMISSTSDIPYLREKMGDDIFGVTTIPVPEPEKEYNINLSGLHIGINPNCKNQEKALELIFFLAGQNQLFCEILKAVPGMVLQMVKDDYLKDDPFFYTKALDIFEASSVVEGFSGKPGAEEYERIFLEELRLFLENDRAPLEAVNTIQARWDMINIEERS